MANEQYRAVYDETLTQHRANSQDFLFDPSDEDAIWIEVPEHTETRKPLVVRIHRASHGVVVDIHTKGQEDGDPVTSTWAIFGEEEE
jgi:hypothetical protein|tara:strand:+ start:1661 stop:1921 length:261 start_codon:yes stop_codon:yes gene_type:complete